MPKKEHQLKCEAYYNRMINNRRDGRVPVLYYERPDVFSGESEMRLWLTKIGERMIAVDDCGGEYFNQVDSGFIYGTRPGANDLPGMAVTELIKKWKSFRHEFRLDGRAENRERLASHA